MEATQERVYHFQEKQMGLQKMGDIIACDKVCLDVCSTSSPLFCDESVFPVNETLGKGICDILLPIENLSLDQ